MDKYTVTFCYTEGLMEFMLHTDLVFETYDEGLAFEVAKDMQSELAQHLKPYYDKKKRDIVVDIKENRHFKRVELYDFSEGTTNEDMFIERGESLSKKEFLKLFEESYEEHMKDREVETFECVAYGIKKVN